MTDGTDGPAQPSLAERLARIRQQDWMRQKAPAFVAELGRILDIPLSQDDILSDEEFDAGNKTLEHQLSKQTKGRTTRTTPMDEEERLLDWITELTPAVEDLPVILFFRLRSFEATTAYIRGAIRVPAGPVLEEMVPVWEFVGLYTLCTTDAEDGLDVLEDWLHEELMISSWGRLTLPQI